MPNRDYADYTEGFHYHCDPGGMLILKSLCVIRVILVRHPSNPLINQKISPEGKLFALFCV